MDVSEFRMSKIVIDETEIQKALSNPSKEPTRTGPAGPAREIPKIVSGGEPEFSVGGLLGETYEKRKQSEAAASASSSVKHMDGPFTEAPSLLNGGIRAMTVPDLSAAPKKQAEQTVKRDEPKSWFPSAAEHSARTRQTTHSHQQQRRPTMAGDVPPSFSSPTSIASSSSMNGCMSRRQRHPAPLLNFNSDVSESPRFQGGFNSAGVRCAPGHPLINFAAGGAAARDPRDPRDPRDAREAWDASLRRQCSRRGGNGGFGPVAAGPPPPQHAPPPPLNSLQRQQSRASAHSQRRYFPNEPRNHLAVPPNPPASLRRLHHGEAPSRPPSRYPSEPLVYRAR
ncbi:hypothetical protein E4U42_001007 [Claviceps africana]|uniref:Uncharacterized protein n=1 Tax=Claviceps africana TaxID=83212 RepID=A0A8K0J063_9HYPO|nr:hypothetical protein E4U42_001007 [Claviceps africana]